MPIVSLHHNNPVRDEPSGWRLTPTHRRRREMEGWCLFSVFKISFSAILKRCHLLRIATIPVRVRSWDEQEGVVHSDQIQRHGDEAIKKRSGHLIADMGNHREVICIVRFRDCEPMIKDDDDRKLPARREVPCASPLVDEDNDVTKKKGKKKANKKAKKKASVVLASITVEQLSAQDPSNIPEDWKLPGKYHPDCIAIWTAWLIFVQVFLDKQTIDGSVLHLVPPLLPWHASHDVKVLSC